MRVVLVVAVITLLGVRAGHADPGCVAVFEEIRAAVETDYVGFPIAIAPDTSRLQQYHADVAIGRAAAASASPTQCSVTLQRFVESVDDPHVFLLERPILTETESAAHRAGAERMRLSRRVMARAAAARGGLEGVWATPEFDVVIVPGARRGVFAAVVSASRNETWAPGDIAGRFVRDGAYWRATLYQGADRVPMRVRAALQREAQMLHMPPTTWGRRTDAANGFDPERPRSPSFVLISNRVALLTIPSFSPEHRETLAGLLMEHDQAIRARELLILDLRGNEGGSSTIGFQLLEPYYGALQLEPFDGPRPHPGAISSPRMLRHYSAMRDQLPADSDARPIFDGFIARMEEAPGTVVPFFDNADISAGFYTRGAPQAVHEAPPRVAILVDRHSVSAAEAFVIEARRSGRVTIYGEPTGRSIDYQNVVMFTVGEGPLRHFLGLPTMASSDELPARGFNRTGVLVDVALQTGTDWVATVSAP